MMKEIQKIMGSSEENVFKDKDCQRQTAQYSNTPYGTLRKNLRCHNPSSLGPNNEVLPLNKQC